MVFISDVEMGTIAPESCPGFRKLEMILEPDECESRQLVMSLPALKVPCSGSEFEGCKEGLGAELRDRYSQHDVSTAILVSSVSPVKGLLCTS